MAMPNDTRTGLTAQRLRSLLSYDPDTGVFRWIAKRTGVTTGAIAGYDCAGYWAIVVDRRLYRAHRLAWLHFYGRWPTELLDHINRNKLDNRIVNLREVTTRQNGWNRPASKNSRTGVRNVMKVERRFVVQVEKGGKKVRGGSRRTLEQAAKEAKRVREELFGEFAGD